METLKGPIIQLHNKDMLSDETTNDLYKELFHNINSGAIVYEVIHDDNLFLIKDLNRTAEEILKFKRYELIGKNMLDAFPNVGKYKLYHTLQKVYKTGIPEQIPISYYKRNNLNFWNENYVFKLSSKYIVSIFKDVKKDKEIKQSLEKFNALFENTKDVILFFSMDESIIDVNNAAITMYGYTKEELLNMSISDLRSIEARHLTKQQIETSVTEGSCFETIHKRKDGNTFPVEVSSVGAELDGNIVRCAIVRDISERKTAEEQIKYLTYHDKLTGIYNRLFLEQELGILISNNKLPISIIISDVNGLKLANDAFGHLIGDVLLKESSKILKDSCKDSSIVARWGGDEFIIVTPFSSETETREIITNIRTKCEESDLIPIKPNMALGYSIIQNKEQNVDDAFKEAENYMYTNKLLESKSLRSSIISSLQETLHESTPETNEHCQRMKKMATKFGRILKLSNVDLDRLALLALLHDIGKIAIPKNILQKPDKLNEKEWEIMKTHCQVGYNITNSTSDLSNISELILYHHERWDGKGYPHGIKERKIPLLSRVISIIDAYDVMLNERPYKKPMTKETTIAELIKNSGTQFDPNLVDTFVNMVK